MCIRDSCYGTSVKELSCHTSLVSVKFLRRELIPLIPACCTHLARGCCCLDHVVGLQLGLSPSLITDSLCLFCHQLVMLACHKLGIRCACFATNSLCWRAPPATLVGFLDLCFQSRIIEAPASITNLWQSKHSEFRVCGKQA